MPLLWQPSEAAEVPLDEKEVKHFCRMLGKKTGIENLTEHVFWHSVSRNEITCSFEAPENAETLPIKDYRALIKNERGNYVKDKEKFTIQELHKEGVYTFDFPETITVERSIFCGDFSCNKFVRNAQEQPEGLTLAEWKGWTLKEVFEYTAEIAAAEEFGSTTGVTIEGTTEAISLLNNTYSIPSFIKIEKV